MELKPTGAISPDFVANLTRGICHDVGAPVRHVVQFTQMLNDDHAIDALDDKHKRWFALIHDGGVQMQNMLSALSELSRLSHAKQLVPVDLKQLFLNVARIHRGHIEGVRQDINLELKGNWPEIYGVQEHWYTLFSCLLENALKFQPQNEHHVVEISVCCEEKKSELLFCIDDNGIGLLEHQREDITRAFKRLNSVEDYSGLGMGLTYCSYIAELNDAKLSFDNSALGGLKVTYRQHICR
ncbi:hypothetical protein CBF23_007595 [Marinomonas agarivorans]|nr:hypothetical protein CBF23_007595 [Marinomonas agarivorans]